MCLPFLNSVCNVQGVFVYIWNYFWVHSSKATFGCIFVTRLLAIVPACGHGTAAKQSLTLSSRHCHLSTRNCNCGWENSTEYHCTPTRTFLKVFTVVETSSDCCNYGSRLKPFSWLKANQLTGSIPSPTWSEQHLPLGGDLREGTRL